MEAKTFALFKKIGITPTAQVLYLKPSRRGGFEFSFKTFDNRFYDDPTNTEDDFENFCKKAIELGYVEVPADIAQLIEEGNYWSNFSKLVPYINSEDFTKAVRNTAGYDGIPELA